MAERDTRFGGNLETANIRPRSIDSYRAERSDNVPDYFKKPYTPSDNIPDPYPLGIELLEKGKNIYDKFKPYIPGVRDDMLNWNIDTDYGNFGFGIGEGKGGLNWSLPFHKASTTVGTGSLRKGIETLKDKFRWGLSEEEKQYLDTPLREPGGIGFGGEIVDKFRTNNPEATIQDLYNYLEEQGRSFQPGDMLDPGDWYNWGENEMEYSI